jgi:hypothetical protein
VSETGRVEARTIKAMLLVLWSARHKTIADKSSSERMVP